MKKVLFLLCLLPCSALALFDYYQAVRAYDRDDFPKAQAIFKKELVNNPNDAELLFSLGDASYRMKEFDQAQAYFARSAASTQDPILKQKALFNAGNAFVEKKQYKEAVAQYDKVLAINPKNSDAIKSKCFMVLFIG